MSEVLSSKKAIYNVRLPMHEYLQLASTSRKFPEYGITFKEGDYDKDIDILEFTMHVAGAEKRGVVERIVRFMVAASKNFDFDPPKK
jgi:hypothetical protein